MKLLNVTIAAVSYNYDIILCDISMSNFKLLIIIIRRGSQMWNVNTPYVRVCYCYKNKYINAFITIK